MYAARSTSTKEKKLTSPPSRRSFAKRQPSTVPASRNLRRKRSPKIHASLRMGAKFDSKSSRTIVFSRNAPPPDAPSGVEFVSGAIGPFVSRLREQPGKDLWLWHGRPARE